MITFSHVTKRYPDGRDALHQLNFTIQSGEMVFLAGHSGAGKSTLLKLIPAIEKVTSGSVIVNGQNVSAMRKRVIPYLRRNIGLIFQDQKLLFDRSAFDNVMLPLAISGFSPKEASRRALAALDKVGLLDRKNSLPIALSGGEQQRLCIARAVVNRPSILLADEPTANLDANYTSEIAEIFQQFHQVGVTVIIATHDDNLLSRIPARILHLKQGRLTQ